MLKAKNEEKGSKKEFKISYKGLDLLHSPVKDILSKLADDTFNPDNRKDKKEVLKRKNEPMKERTGVFNSKFGFTGL